MSRLGRSLLNRFLKAKGMSLRASKIMGDRGLSKGLLARGEPSTLGRDRDGKNYPIESEEIGLNQPGSRGLMG